MKHLKKLNEDTILDYEAWGKRIIVSIDNDNRGGYVEMKVGDAEETRDNTSSMNQLVRRYLTKNKDKEELEPIVDQETGELDDWYEDWDDEEYEPGSDEPVGSTNYKKFKAGDRVNQATFGDGIIKKMSPDCRKANVIFDKGGDEKQLLLSVAKLRKI